VKGIVVRWGETKKKKKKERSEEKPRDKFSCLMVNLARIQIKSISRY
jgi:hypothetical protein